MRLAERLGVDAETASQTYYACLLFYVGCTADAEIAADLFDETALATHFTPVMFGSRREPARRAVRALAPPDGRGAGARAADRAPAAARGRAPPAPLAALCEVAQMLTDRLGLPAAVQALFAGFTERWDGKGEPGRREGEEIPLAVRIAHVARDAAFQRMLGGAEHAARVVRERPGGAFDPAVAAWLADDAGEILALGARDRRGTDVLACEPAPAPDARGRGDRPGAGGDGRLRRPSLAVPGRPLGGRRGAGGAAAERCRLGGRRCAFVARRSSTTSGGSRSRCGSGRSPGR